MSGMFYGIGVGPGDPELLTVKAINAIKKADVLIAPKTEKKDGSVALLHLDALFSLQNLPPGI